MAKVFRPRRTEVQSEANPAALVMFNDPYLGMWLHSEEGRCVEVEEAQTREGWGPK